MSNHPNRNWRQRMEAVADQFLESSAGKVLVEVPLVPVRPLDGLRYRIREAFLQGYQAGRKREL